MTCVPYFFTEQQAINTSPSCVCEEHRDPNCTTSMVPVSPSLRSPRRAPLPPLEANTHAADAVPLPATILSSGPNAEVDNFVEAFLSSLPEIGAGNDANFLSEGGTADEIDTAPHPPDYCLQSTRRGGQTTMRKASFFLMRQGGPFSPVRYLPYRTAFSTKIRNQTMKDMTQRGGFHTLQMTRRLMPRITTKPHSLMMPAHRQEKLNLRRWRRCRCQN
jgi:hypothetical protein